MLRRPIFIIDLNEIKGEGDFPCPLCKETISPDDESGRIYEVIAYKTMNDGSMEETSIICEKCGSIIHLRGYEMLGEIEAPLLL